MNVLRNPLRSVLRSAIGSAFPGEWLPTDINAYVWYDPSDASSMTVERDGSGGNPGTGDPVGKILDKSGNGYHAAASSDAARPTIDASSSLPSIRFDGVDDNLDAPWTGTTSMSVFFRVKTSSASLIMASREDTSGFIGCALEGGATNTSTGLDAPYPDYVNDVLVNPATRDGLYTALSTGAWSTLEVRSGNLSDWLSFALSGYPGSFRFTGDIGAVVIINGVLSDGDRQNLLTYMDGWS